MDILMLDQYHKNIQNFRAKVTGIELISISFR